MGKLFDKRGIPIERGDVVKVYHFTAALRRKKHYMYKQCLGLGSYCPGGTGYMFFSHLNFNDDIKSRKDSPYSQKPDGRVLPDYEIVQSIDGAFEDRPRTALAGSKSKEGSRDE